MFSIQIVAPAPPTVLETSTTSTASLFLSKHNEICANFPSQSVNTHVSMHVANQITVPIRSDSPSSFMTQIFNGITIQPFSTSTLSINTSTETQTDECSLVSSCSVPLFFTPMPFRNALLAHRLSDENAVVPTNTTTSVAPLNGSIALSDATPKCLPCIQMSSLSPRRGSFSPRRGSSLTCLSVSSLQGSPLIGLDRSETSSGYTRTPSLAIPWGTDMLFPPSLSGRRLFEGDEGVVTDMDWQSDVDGGDVVVGNAYSTNEEEEAPLFISHLRADQPCRIIDEYFMPFDRFRRVLEKYIYKCQLYNCYRNVSVSNKPSFPMCFYRWEGADATVESGTWSEVILDNADVIKQASIQKTYQVLLI